MRGDCWVWVEQIVPARRRDSVGLISIWATPPKRLVFWDGAPSPSKTSFDRHQLRKEDFLIKHQLSLLLISEDWLLFDVEPSLTGENLLSTDKG